MGRTLKRVRPGSTVYCTASTLDTRLACVSITPLLFPVVPEVKMIVAISLSPLPSTSSAPMPDPLSKDRASSSRNQISLTPGHDSFTLSANPTNLGLTKRALESDRLIRSIRSSAGRLTSRGTATLSPVVMPR